jgi:hypothetical protein
VSCDATEVELLYGAVRAITHHHGGDYGPSWFYLDAGS